MQLRITKPLLEIQNDAYDKIKSLLYTHVTVTSDFPEWKQANFLDTFSEVKFRGLGQPLTTEEQAYIDYIDEVRVWKNALFTERDRVKGEIFAATSVYDIVVATNSMIYLQMPVML